MSERITVPLFLGVDVSKGYADLQLLNAAGRKCGLADRFDDTPAGHAAVRQRLLKLQESYCARGEDPQLRVGVEASGGLERNWLRSFQSLPAEISRDVYRLNPLAVRRFRDQELHYSVTDPLSADTIAEYLRRGLRKADIPFEDPEPGALALYRYPNNCIGRLVQLKNELQSLLPAVHPELVQYCRKQFPDWVLTLLAAYPTAPQLAGTEAATLAGIPQVTFKRAEALITAAQQSVAALRDEPTGTTVRFLVQDIRHLAAQIDGLKEQLITRMQADATVKILISIPGVGPWTATVVRLEVGRFDRFAKAAALVAYAGLDPCYYQSGDQQVEFHISKRGRAHLRAALWMAALSGIRCNPVLREFYQRLRKAGKRGDVALVACAGKLLRLAFACVVSQKPFDPEYAAKQRARQAEAAAASEAAPAPANPTSATAAATATAPSETAPTAPPTPAALDAPVSSREAKRRKAQAAGTPVSSSQPQQPKKRTARVPHMRPAQ